MEAGIAIKRTRCAIDCSCCQNPEHLDIVAQKLDTAKAQGKLRPGFIICISNCSTAGLVCTIEAL
ncbi:AIF_HP2_G0052350.mRNA.1.CDS.1 [Saccharomyces cerevisiae]|nr:AIF_HP2_G0052350.mRNA.1.CDS.1 [Saccharomyces cerevisiae]CAI6797915.1 AIF_HP2_G0052350.mRNA.1.CDS.1 [Saccharomyces cerevisiae]